MKTFHDIEAKQINFLDERFYTKDGEVFYPSVTTVLDAYPKGYGFVQWLKDNGTNADEVVKRAAEQGSRIHDAIDRYLRGEELQWTAEGNYNLDEWMMILKFVEFWSTYKPEILANEETIVSEKEKIGGTIDLVCKIGDEIWLIDYKTGNAIHHSHELQLSAYRTLWNEAYPTKQITRSGIMHLKAMTRGADKSGKQMQGKGWLVKEFERPFTDAYRIFGYTYALWREENPVIKPKNLVYPDRVSLAIINSK